MKSADVGNRTASPGGRRRGRGECAAAVAPSRRVAERSAQPVRLSRAQRLVEDGDCLGGGTQHRGARRSVAQVVEQL
jgi:hypothetical protein